MRSILIFSLIISAVLISSCQQVKDNQLTKEEKNTGWKLLFDGKTLEGWKIFKNLPGSSWEVSEGALCSMKPVTDQNPDIISETTYENFELSIDWKLSPQGNSGIMYLVTENNNNTYESGPEYQLIDDDNFPEKIEDYQKSGANYAMQAPAVKALNPSNEWNHSVIIVNKGHVEHWLNDKKVVEYELWSEEWKKQKEAGKWKDVISYGAEKSGHIALQASHSGVNNTGVCFKNIKIKIR